jgi:hypothetical protein
MKQVKILFSILAAFFVLSLSIQAMAGEVDILVRKLVEKGILNKDEGDKILQETKQEAAKEKEQAVKEVQAEVAKDVKEGKLALLPEWIRKTRFYGDFRLRYEYGEVMDSRSQSRGRFRVRLNLETEVAKNLKFIFGIASGSNNPRSNDQSFTNDSDKKQININYAYVDYAPFQWLKLQGGKMPRPFYTVSQLVWDEDINPEGVAAQIKYPVNPCIELLMNAGAFQLSDNNNNTPVDAWMWGIQPGVMWRPNEKTQLKAAAGFTAFENFQDNPQQKYSSGTNTYVQDGTDKVYRYKYNLVNMAGELGFRNPIPAFTPIRYAGLFAEYTNNISTSNGKSGYLTGLTFGDEKVVEKCQWNFRGSWRRLEKNAAPDILPDSNFYFGYTGVKGYTAQFRYGLLKNVNFTTTYFRAFQISGPGKPLNLFHTDMNFKF